MGIALDSCCASRLFGLACDGLAESGTVAATVGDCGGIAASCCGSDDAGSATDAPLLSTVAVVPGWVTAVGAGASLRPHAAIEASIRQAASAWVIFIMLAPELAVGRMQK